MGREYDTRLLIVDLTRDAVRDVVVDAGTTRRFMRSSRRGRGPAAER